MPDVLRVMTQIIKYYFNYIVRCKGNKNIFLRYLGARIGDDCHIYVRNFSEPWLIEIGDRVTITAGVMLLTHDGSSRLFRRKISGMNSLFGNKFDPIRILDDCFIGVNSIVLPGVTIGPNSIVGAGSVVTKDVPPDTVVVGNPARTLCSTQEYEQRYKQRMISIKAVDREELRKELTLHFWGEER